jgi:hypothetical protein
MREVDVFFLVTVEDERFLTGDWMTPAGPVRESAALGHVDRSHDPDRLTDVQQPQLGSKHSVVTHLDRTRWLGVGNAKTATPFQQPR